MKFMNSIVRAYHMAGFKLRAASPEILVVTGVVGTVVGAVMACKATLKLDDILDEAGETIENVNKASENESLKDKYTPTDRKRDLAVVYIQTGVKVAKLYAPAAFVAGVSVAGILAGHTILRKRNIALAAAYATVDKGFREYRKGVIDKFGETVDREMRHGIKAVKLMETVTNEKSGEPKEVETMVEGVGKAPSDYARLFEEGNFNWDKGGNMEYNLQFLRAQQQYANNLLQAQGYLFLNEVYEMLGFEPTKAGRVVGWIYDPKNPVGDNFVDFGMRVVHETNETSDYRDDWDRAVLLDFNVDGNIFERVKW